MIVKRIFNSDSLEAWETQFPQTMSIKRPPDFIAKHSLDFSLIWDLGKRQEMYKMILDYFITPDRDKAVEE